MQPNTDSSSKNLFSEGSGRHGNGLKRCCDSVKQFRTAKRQDNATCERADKTLQDCKTGIGSEVKKR